MKQLSFARPLVMGILNITPDSFFDGGNYIDPDQAYEHMLNLVEAGADIIDIGAASSRPGYQPVDVEDELARLQPFWQRVGTSLPLPFSIDTDKIEVAEAALAAGATIINNTGDPSAQMAELAKRYNAYMVIMFKGPFKSDNIMQELDIFFKNAIAEALAAGVEENKLIIDPGVGFNMSMEECITIVREQQQLCSLGLPLLMGMSNKRFVAAISGDTPLAERLSANIATELYSVDHGASILRVHNVAATVRALRAYEILKGKNNG